MRTELTRNEDEIKKLFKEMTHFRDVANLLEVPPYVLKHHLYKKEYTAIQVPKKRGGVRVLHAPSNSLKILQRKFLRVLDIVTSNQKYCVHSFVKGQGKSIKSNALAHRKKRVILTVDLKDFYPSITYPRVFGLFRKAPFNFNSMVSASLANLCCYEKQLPQGAPTSPMISNLIARKMDNQFLKLAKDARITYSRYADDLTFSTTLPELPSILTSELESTPVEGSKTLHAEIIKNGFSINTEKTRVMKSGHRQLVTGVIVNNKKMNLRRETIRQIRAALNAWRKYGYENAKSKYIESYKVQLTRKENPSENLGSVLKGKIDHLGHIRGQDDPIYLKFMFQLWNLEPRVISEKEYNKKLKPYEDRNKRLGAALWLLEAELGGNQDQGTAFALEGINGLITCKHCLPPSRFFYVWQPHNGDMTRVLVEEIWSDRDLDAAVLAPPQGRTLSPLKLGRSVDHQQMSDVLIAGFPNWGEDSHSIISAKIMARRTYFGESVILLDRGIVKGNSGGPVTDIKGSVIGIAQRGVPRRDAQFESEAHFVIPIERILSAIGDSLSPNREGEVADMAETVGG